MDDPNRPLTSLEVPHPSPRLSRRVDSLVSRSSPSSSEKGLRTQSLSFVPPPTLVPCGFHTLRPPPRNTFPRVQVPVDSRTSSPPVLTVVVPHRLVHTGRPHTRTHPGTLTHTGTLAHANTHWDTHTHERTHGDVPWYTETPATRGTLNSHTGPTDVHTGTHSLLHHSSRVVTRRVGHSRVFPTSTTL